MMENENVFSINEKEVMDFYGLKGGLGKISLRSKIFRSWLLHKSAFSSIISPLAVFIMYAVFFINFNLLAFIK